MALPSILPEHFTGFFKIASNSYKSDLLQGYIDQFYKKYLRAVLGDAAYLDAKDTTEDKWTDLLNGADYVDSGNNKTFEGVRSAIIGLIYFEFVRDNFASSNNGMHRDNSENSSNLTATEISAIANSRYNYAVEILKIEVYGFLSAHYSIDRDVVSVVDNLNNTYAITISSTKYLYVGDEVTINDIIYDVVSITDATTFVINAGGVGYSFNEAVTWHPYEDVEFDPLNYIAL